MALGQAGGGGGSATGSWTTNPGPWPVFAIHMTLLPNKSLLVFNRGRFPPYFPSDHRTPWKIAIVAPPYETGTVIPFWDDQEHTPHELFCSGHVMLEDGKVFFAGGHIVDNVGTFDTHTFDPATNQFVLGSEMKERRWYPTAVLLPNRRVAIFSGTFNNTPGVEKRNPFVELWMDRVGDTLAADYITDIPEAQKYTDRYYPQVFVDPNDGNLIFCAAGVSEDAPGTGIYWPERNAKLNLLTWTWSDYLPLQTSIPNVRLEYPSAVMMDGVIIKSGGGKIGESSEPEYYATNRVLTCDLKNITDPNAAWKMAPGMVKGRKNHTLVALPDGHVLAMGGNLYHQFGQLGGPETNDHSDNERSAPEWWDPFNPSSRWTLLSKPTPDTGRGYHSTALLLPDARVIQAGGEYEYQQVTVGGAPIVDQKRTAQIFSPPYGGRNDWARYRPRIVTAPDATTPVVHYGEDLNIVVRKQPGRAIAKISLISLGSTTHAFNENQRFVFLNKESLPTSNNSIAVRLPASPNIAAPGYYMLFVVDNAGIPSEALIVRLKDMDFAAPQTVSVNVPYDLDYDRTQIYAGDNRYLGGPQGISSSGANEFSIDFTTTAPYANPSHVRVNAEARMSRAGRTRIFLWDWEKGAWQDIANYETGTSDALVRGVERLEDSWKPYVNPNDRSVKVRLTFTADEPFIGFLDMVEVGFRD